MAKFKTRARALDMLGRQQIADISTAINELFKNAHDAYADRVEVDYYHSDSLFVLRDDGLGMTKDEFLDRWLTIGTESKVTKNFIKDPTKAPRPTLGEKGIGRLAIAVIGPQVLVLSRAKREGKLCELVAAVINWGFFECPGLDLDDINIPIRTFGVGQLPTENDISSMVEELAAGLDELKGDFPVNLYDKIKHEMGLFKVNPIEIDAYVENMQLRKSCGTHFIIKPTDELLDTEIGLGSDVKASQSTPNLIKMLGGFSNTMTPGHDSPVLKAVFRNHKYDESYDDLIDEQAFFTPEEFAKADHQFWGSFDAHGQFKGVAKVFDKQIEDYIVPWPDGKGKETLCGEFKFFLADTQGNFNETMMLYDDYHELADKMKVYGGVYVYKNGIRILPYGNSDTDWLNIEKRRSVKLDYFHFSHRRLFGAALISSPENENLREKAGREGFRENKAFRQFRSILSNFFEQLAKDFFRKESADDYFQSKRKELKEQHAAITARNDSVRGRKKQFVNALQSFFSNYEKKKPHDEVKLLVDSYSNQLEVISRGSDREKAAASLLTLESSVRKELNSIVKKYKIIKPRMGLAKHISREWEAYLRCFDNLEKEEFSRARSFIENEIGKAAERAKIYINAQQRLETYLSELSDAAQKDARKEKKNVVIKAKRVSDDVAEAARDAFSDVYKSVKSIFVQFSKLDISAMDSQEIEFHRSRLEKKLIEVRDDKIQFIHSLSEQLDGINLSNGPTTIDQIAAVEQKAISLEEQSIRDLQLAQLGMAVEVVNHEFDSNIRFIRQQLKRLKSWANVNDGLQDIYTGIRTSFDHLDGYLTLFTPLQRRMKRNKVRIEGKSIGDFILNLFSERLRRHNVILKVTKAFKEVCIESYPSTFYPVFVNLVDNAIFWVKNCDLKEIVLDARGPKLIVRDSGSGVAARDVDAIFEFGFSRKPEGRGMGLHISREVLAQVGYKLSVNVLEIGTEFQIVPEVKDEQSDD